MNTSKMLLNSFRAIKNDYVQRSLSINLKTSLNIIDEYFNGRRKEATDLN